MLGLYGQMYAAKLSGALDAGAINPTNSKLKKSESDDVAIATEEAAFSADKLMAWLDDPANKARMYARTQGLWRGAQAGERAQGSKLQAPATGCSEPDAHLHQHASTLLHIHLVLQVPKDFHADGPEPSHSQG